MSIGKYLGLEEAWEKEKLEIDRQGDNDQYL